jgi:hypothetical protein
MIRDNCRSLWHTIRPFVIGFLWENRCKAAFNEEPSSLSLGYLKLFKQGLALLLKVEVGFSAKIWTLYC